MFAYAKDHQPCVIFMDEIDAIGGRRLSQGTSSDREVQRTLMELLNQLDGFDDCTFLLVFFIIYPNISLHQITPFFNTVGKLKW